MSNIYNLPFISGFFEKLVNLRTDFINFNLNFEVLISFFFLLTFSFFMIFICYAFGKKFLYIFLKRDLSYLVNIAIGYIAFSLVITLLGVFSYLNIISICGSVLLFLVFGFLFPLSIKDNLNKLFNEIRSSIKILESNKLVYFGVLLFLLIAIVNLINPEIREDQYHVDYPRMYIREHTIMIPPKEDLHVSGSSMMAEMFYLPAIYITNSFEIARYLHFGFYILTILTLLEFSKLNRYKFFIYTPLLFVTAPVVIHETSSMYTDFQWIFLFLLSLFIFLRSINSTKIFILMGLLLGGMLATKLWTIALIPPFILFAFIQHSFDIRSTLKNVSYLLIGILFASFIWFIRAFILTGDPFFPAFYMHKNLGNITEYYNLARYFTLNINAFNPLLNLNVASPLFFASIVLIFINFKTNMQNLRSFIIFKLVALVFIIYIFINYPYGRYLLGLYILLIFGASLFIDTFLKLNKKWTLFFYLLTLIVFCYYFLNSILVLPYAFGLTDKNKYLSRILLRDNSSYYDFGKKFDRYIAKSDLVAMYNFHGYYYANFNYEDVNFVFGEGKKSFNLLKVKRFTKLMTRGGDIDWFCEQIKLSNCKKDRYTLISSYLVFPNYYLYELR